MHFISKDNPKPLLEPAAVKFTSTWVVNWNNPDTKALQIEGVTAAVLTYSNEFCLFQTLRPDGTITNQYITRSLVRDLREEATPNGPAKEEEKG